MENKKYSRTLKHLLSTPFVWVIIFPLIILDFFIELYHRICFPLYGIPIVKRKKYIRIDRHKLKYLSRMEKINCAYCGYANGLLRYALIIAGETEKYWCGIKHKQDNEFIAPSHHKNFPGYGDEENFRERYQQTLFKK